MYAEEIISKIDGPLFREQRRALLRLQIATSATDKNYSILMGINYLLDEIADCAHDVYGKDCLLIDPDMELKAEENDYEQKVQQYNH